MLSLLAIVNLAKITFCTAREHYSDGDAVFYHLPTDVITNRVDTERH